MEFSASHHHARKRHAERKGRPMNGVLICSVSPEEYIIKRNSYIYQVHIPACPPGQAYSSFLVTDQTDNRRVYNDLTHIDVIPHHISAKAIVADVFKTEEL